MYFHCDTVIVYWYLYSHCAILSLCIVIYLIVTVTLLLCTVIYICHISVILLYYLILGLYCLLSIYCFLPLFHGVYIICIIVICDKIVCTVFFISYLNHIDRFQHLKVSVVIDRLILRRKYWLALAICQYLKISESEGASRILAHWACYKVSELVGL